MIVKFRVNATSSSSKLTSMIPNVAWKRFNDVRLAIEELEKGKVARRYEIRKNCHSAVARAKS